MLDERISTLIMRIYSAAHDAIIWDDVVKEILALTDSHFIMLSAVDLASGEYAEHRFHGPDNSRFLDATLDYGEHLYKEDSLLAYGMRNPDAGFASLRTVLADSGISYDEDSYVAWLRGNLGADNSIVRYTPGRDGLSLGISLHTRAGHAAHSKEQISLVNLLFKHIEHSVRLAARPPDLKGETDAVVIVGHGGRIMVMSGAAERIIAENDGLGTSGGQLVAATHEDGKNLDALIMSAHLAFQTGRAGGFGKISRPSGKRPLIVTVHPFRMVQDLCSAYSPVAMLRIVDPNNAPASNNESDHWITLFELTKTEARLAEVLIGHAENLTQAAEILGIAHSTARVHLSHIFEKVGVRSQLQLMRLLNQVSSGRWLTG